MIEKFLEGKGALITGGASGIIKKKKFEYIENEIS